MKNIRMKPLAAAFAAGWFAAAVAGTANGTARLADGNMPQADIVIAADATRVARFAALDLKWHLDRMTGGDFKIVSDAEAPGGRYALCVGPSRLTALKSGDFGPQQWAWRFGPGHAEFVGLDSEKRGVPSLAITAGGSVSGTNWPSIFDPQGTMYAVYDFLERECGVRWCDSTDVGTVVPKVRRMEVAFKERRGEPFIAYRGGCELEENYQPLFWPGNSAGAKRYNRLAYADVKGWQRQSMLFRMRHRAGGDRAPANHSFYGWYARFLSPKSKSFEGWHPEYFSVGCPTNTTPPQLCYTSEAVIRQVVKDAREYLADPDGNTKYRSSFWQEGYWGRNHFGLEPMDNSAFCRCERCRALIDRDKNRPAESRHSTYWFTFVNRVAKELKATNPSATILTLAYGTHMGLPDLKLEDNVVVYFCYSDNRSPYAATSRQLDRVLEWRRAYPKQALALWLYNCFPQLIAEWGRFNCFPGFFAREEARQYRFFRAHDIRAGIFHCGFSGEADNYLQLELMLDPDRDVDGLLDEYFSMYGAAAKPMREFYEIVQDRFLDRSLYPKGGGHQTFAIAWGSLGTPEVMERLRACVESAEKLVATPEEKRRVELFRAGIWDYMTAGSEKYRRRQRAPVPTFVCTRVAEAGGDLSKIAWETVPTVPYTLYASGDDKAIKMKPLVRTANDGTHFYLEITSFVNSRRIQVSPKVAPNDTWEILIARQTARPYRYYVSGADGRLACSSFGEVNWRNNVPAAETMGDETFKAKCVSDRSRKDRWTMRWAFPLDNAADRPLNPGDEFFMNATAVWNFGLPGEKVDGARWAILSFTSFTQVHTPDRTAKVRLAR